MIKVCVADNFPVVHYGIKSFFKDHSDISIVANIGNFSMLKEILQSKEIDVLLLDLELEGLKSIFEVKAILKEFPETKVIIYSNLSEQIYAPNAIKAGVSGFIHKKEKLSVVYDGIKQVTDGKIVMNETVKKKSCFNCKEK